MAKHSAPAAAALLLVLILVCAQAPAAVRAQDKAKEAAPKDGKSASNSKDACAAKYRLQFMYVLRDATGTNLKQLDELAKKWLSQCKPVAAGYGPAVTKQPEVYGFKSTPASVSFADWGIWVDWASLDDLKACYASGLKSGVMPAMRVFAKQATRVAYPLDSCVPNSDAVRFMFAYSMKENSASACGRNNALQRTIIGALGNPPASEGCNALGADAAKVFGAESNDYAGFVDHKDVATMTKYFANPNPTANEARAKLRGTSSSSMRIVIAMPGAAAAAPGSSALAPAATPAPAAHTKDSKDGNKGGACLAKYRFQWLYQMKNPADAPKLAAALDRRFAECNPVAQGHGAAVTDKPAQLKFGLLDAKQEFSYYAGWNDWKSLEDAKACFEKGLKSGNVAATREYVTGLLRVIFELNTCPDYSKMANGLHYMFIHTLKAKTKDCAEVAKLRSTALKGVEHVGDMGCTLGKHVFGAESPHLNGCFGGYAILPNNEALGKYLDALASSPERARQKELTVSAIRTVIPAGTWKAPGGGGGASKVVIERGPDTP